VWEGPGFGRGFSRHLLPVKILFRLTDPFRDGFPKVHYFGKNAARETPLYP
jgi:hypothetical protein